MSESTLSKAAFKARVLEVLRDVEASGRPVVITDRGRPVVRVEPYFGGDDAALEALRGSVLAYQEPLEPVANEDWEALR
jgi:prevent-host-death family protein